MLTRVILTSGPRVFMNCPLETMSSDIEVWFINLWNHFIIPYLMGTIMAGIEVMISMWAEAKGLVSVVYDDSTYLHRHILLTHDWTGLMFESGLWRLTPGNYSQFTACTN